MRVNPLTYGMDALSRALANRPAAPSSMVLSVGIMTAFGMLAGLASLREVRRSPAAGAV
jgi:ABC-type multidrug transport system permease subunit